MQRFVALLLLLALLAACSAPFNQPDNSDSPNPNNPSADGKVTITYAAWESDRRIYEPVAQRFMAENPDINVVIVPIDDMLNVQVDGPESQLAALRRVVSGADTAPAFVVSPEAFGTNLLYDMAPLMDADASFQRSDFYPGALERVTVDGGVWMLPRYFYAQILSYNKDLFEINNLPEPQAGWSWNDLLGAAEQIAEKNGRTVETYGLFDGGSGFMALFDMLQQQDINILATPVREVQLDRPEIVAALERVRTLSQDGALFQYELAGGEVDPTQLVRDGRVGIWASEMISPYIYDEQGNETLVEFDFEVGKVPYPASEFGGYTGTGDGSIISGGTAHPNEAWKWIEFLSRQQIENVDGGGAYYSGRLPARQSLAEQIGFWDNMDEETVAAYRWVLENPVQPTTNTPDYTAVSALWQALSTVLNDPQADTARALADAQRQLEDQLAQVELTPTPEPDLSPVVVATPEPQGVPEGATAITFGVPGYYSPEMRRLARAFQNQRPDIYIEITSTDNITGPVDIQTIAQNNDCFNWWGAPTTSEEFSALLDLKPLFDSDATFDIDDYPQTLLVPFEHEGRLLGLPYAYNARTLGYNRTAFSDAGIGTPRYEWTPDDFLAAAQSLTVGEGDQKQYGYVPIGGPMSDMLFFITAFGAQLTTGSGENIRPNFDDPQVVRAINWYLDLSRVHKVSPEFKLSYKAGEDYYEDNTYQLVQEGRAGMWFDWGYGMFGYQDGPIENPNTGRTFEVGVSPLPTGGRGMSTGDFSVRGYHISAQSDEPQACWDWLKFLSADTTGLQGDIPARTSVAQSEAFTQQATPAMLEMVEAYSEALDQPGRIGDPNGFYSLGDTYWFFKAVDEALKGEVDLDQGLVAAQETTIAFQECMERQDEFRPATCAREVDPDYQGWNTEDPIQDPGMPRPLG